jgi:hypothetical protein
MPNANGLPKWVIPIMMFLIGTLATGAVSHFALGSSVAENTVRIDQTSEHVQNYVRLTEEIVKVNQDLIAEIRAERAVRERLGP